MTQPPDDVQGSVRSPGTRSLRVLLWLAAVASAAVILVRGIVTTSQDLDVLTSPAAQQSSRAETGGYQCLEAALRRAIPRGAEVFDAVTSVLLYQRVAESLTPGYTLVQDAEQAQYVVDVTPGTTCGLYTLAVIHGGSR